VKHMDLYECPIIFCICNVLHLKESLKSASLVGFEGNTLSLENARSPTAEIFISRSTSLSDFGLRVTCQMLCRIYWNTYLLHWEKKKMTSLNPFENSSLLKMPEFKRALYQIRQYPSYSIEKGESLLKR
jgi:hypothetical protein